MSARVSGWMSESEWVGVWVGELVSVRVSGWMSESEWVGVWVGE